MAIYVVIFGLVCLAAGIVLTRPVPVERKQEQWKGLSRVDKNRLRENFTEEERVEKRWPEDYNLSFS